MFIHFREREREKNINVREKRQLVASPVHPDRESNPQPFGVWEPPGQAIRRLLHKNIFATALERFMRSP